MILFTESKKRCSPQYASGDSKWPSDSKIFTPSEWPSYIQPYLIYKSKHGNWFWQLRSLYLGTPEKSSCSLGRILTNLYTCVGYEQVSIARDIGHCDWSILVHGLSPLVRGWWLNWLPTNKDRNILLAKWNKSYTAV